MRAAAVLVAIACTCGVADASPRPWEERSTAAQRKQAHKTFAQGNDHFFRREYARALELYEQALAELDHPRIRLAAAEVLLMLGRPVDAHAHIEVALRWGAAPFDEDEHARAVELQKMLRRQLGTLVVRCTSDGAHVTLDGRALLECPGEVRTVVMPGPHQIVANQHGHVPFTENVTVEPAKETAIGISLKPFDRPMRFERRRRWAAWKPWAAVSTGAAVAVVGGVLQWRASTNMSAFRSAVDACGLPEGCPPGHAAFDLESRARLQNGAAISLWVVGGAIAVGGFVAVYLNREQTVALEDTGRIAIVPALGPDGFGLVVRGAL